MPDDAIERIKVKPAINPETGLPYYTWHPSQFRKPLAADGTLVPLDLYTRRCLKDGSWLECEAEPAVAPKQAPKHVRDPAIDMANPERDR